MLHTPHMSPPAPAPTPARSPSRDNAPRRLRRKAPTRATPPATARVAADNERDRSECALHPTTAPATRRCGTCARWITFSSEGSLTWRLERLADGEDRVAGQGLVDDHARDAHHRGAAVVALGVELPRLAEDELVLADLLGGAIAQPHVVAVGVARPRNALGDHIARGLVGVLLQPQHLADGDEEDDLEPRRGRQRRP